MISDIQKLSQAWNIGLLSGLNEDGDDGGESGNDNDDDNLGDDSSIPQMLLVQKDDKYFKSPLFFACITDRVNKIKSAISSQALSHEE